MLASGTPYYSLRNLTKGFGPKAILRGLNLDIERGRTTVLLGRSGGGKSVLLKHLATLLQPDSGQIFIDGTDVSRLSERKLEPYRLKIGMMFQEGALFDSYNVAENVAFALLLRKKYRRGPELLDLVRSTLDQVQLGDQLTTMPAKLSGGMRKRVALARALIDEPEVILYDEPTSGLDPITGKSIDELILRTQERLRVTSVVITHDMESALRVADRICLLEQGVIAWQGSPEQMLASTHPVVNEFLAASGQR